MYIYFIIIIISWRYRPGWALASAAICLQVSRSLALSLHSFIPIFLRSMDTSSSHLILGLPLRLVAYSFPYSIFFGIAVSCILPICPSHLILWVYLFNLPYSFRQHNLQVLNLLLHVSTYISHHSGVPVNPDYLQSAFADFRSQTAYSFRIRTM